MSDKKKRIFISVPINHLNEKEMRARVKELSDRVVSKGYEAVSPFDVSDGLDEAYAETGGKPDWNNYVAECIYELLQCDGILVDVNAKDSKKCAIELAVAQVMAAKFKNGFTIYHTKEQWADVKRKFTM